MIFFLLMVAAQADNSSVDQEIWTQLNEGRVMSLTNADQTEAIELYRALLTGLSRTSPVYYELQYWLARSHAKQGNFSAARKAIQSSLLSDPLKAEAEEFLFEMNRWENHVPAIPYRGHAWINSLGKKTSERSNFFSVAFSSYSISISEISFDVNVLESMTLMTSVQDWSGATHNYQIDLEQGKHSINVPLLSIDQPLLSLNVSALDSYNRNIMFSLGELIIR